MPGERQDYWPFKRDFCFKIQIFDRSYCTGEVEFRRCNSEIFSPVFHRCAATGEDRIPNPSGMATRWQYAAAAENERRMGCRWGRAARSAEPCLLFHAAFMHICFSPPPLAYI